MTDTITRYPRTLTPVRRNRVENARAFVNANGYTFDGASTTGTAVRAFGLAGTVSSTGIRATLTASAATWWGITYTDGSAVTPGATYIFSTYLRSVSAARNVSLVIAWIDNVGAVISTSDLTPTAITINTWTRFSLTGVAPAGAASAQLVARVTNGGSNGWILEATGYLFEQSATLGFFFDGSRADAPPLYYRWQGAEYASQSTENVVNPADIITPTIIDGYEGSSEARTIVHSVIGATTTNVTFAPVGPKSGRMQLVFASKADAATAATVLTAGAMFILDTDQNAPIDMTFVVANGALTLRLDPETRSVWLLEVPFQEVT